MNDGSIIRARAKKIREAVDASPVFQRVMEGLDRISEISKGQLTYVKIYKDERRDEPNSWDIIAVLEINLTVTGIVRRKPLFKPSYLEEFSRPLALAFKADGQIRSIGFTDVDIKSGESIYPAPNRKRFAWRQARIDAANEAAVSEVLDFVEQVAFQAELIPTESPRASTPPNSSSSALDTLRSTLGTPSADTSFLDGDCLVKPISPSV